jgi:Na+/H+ antiporter NhaD/arsenite permease-like protein
MSSLKSILNVIILLVIPSLGFPVENGESMSQASSDLTHHIVGYLSLGITVLAYVIAMMEDVIELRKSKPMVLGAALVWFVICVFYAMNGEAKVAVKAFESNLLAYVELLLFILVSMTYLNAMEDRGIFDGMRIWLLNRQYSYQQLFWILGTLAFFLSAVVSGLAVGLLFGTIAMAVGKHNHRFVALACVHIVSATNAGGSFSPLGGISTLFVWQSHVLHFFDFLTLFIPCLVNFLVPAIIMHFFVPKEVPLMSKSVINLKRGSKRIILLFCLTLTITVLSNVYLELPPAAGMMAGLALLQMFSFYLMKSAQDKENDRLIDEPKPAAWLDDRNYDIFQKIGNLEWDTLLFFYGAMMIIGALGFVGYLDAIAHYLFGEINTSYANLLIGLSSAFIDNGTLMFAVLNMHPNMPIGQWLLLTLTLGVGGSLLAIGSAPGVGLLGQIKGIYTFGYHMRWLPVILLGYFASVAVHFWVNARFF